MSIYADLVARARRNILETAILDATGDARVAAEALGIPIRTLYRHLRAAGLPVGTSSTTPKMARAGGDDDGPA